MILSKGNSYRDGDGDECIVVLSAATVDLCTVLYCTVLYCTVLFTVLCRFLLYRR